MKAMTNFVVSVTDQNLREAETIYYGVEKEIIELDYYDIPQTVFYYNWVRVEDKVNGCTFDAEANFTFVKLLKLKRKSKVDDEPYCLSSQASQVFYCQDPTRTDWSVVINAPKRLDKDIDAYEEPLVFEIENPFTSLMMGLINENVDEDEEIVEGSWMMISPSQSTPNTSEPLPIPTGGSHEHSTTSGGDSSKPKIPLKLSLLGHVVGKNSTKFMSCLGNLVREHIPPYYPDWPVVPDRFKDTVWQIICDIEKAESQWEVRLHVYPLGTPVLYLSELAIRLVYLRPCITMVEVFLVLMLNPGADCLSSALIMSSSIRLALKGFVDLFIVLLGFESLGGDVKYSSSSSSLSKTKHGSYTKHTVPEEDGGEGALNRRGDEGPKGEILRRPRIGHGAT
ncbi:hypothetical protein GIB67_015288 [Kingdonia uniflora]|uniref:DUF4216 domain-containing protein n=1 Tax=Kingdonia uniflora TaxID=39325 RepID=A0A7J7MT37_9MAGN|nr:hypothetical protein GIB67_015288 [Kingdonia uniflora]